MARNPHAQSRHMAVKVEEFAPEIIVRFLTERAQAGLPVAPPCHQTFMSVVVFADICGFTALSERFAEKGGLGSEDLGFFLNRCVPWRLVLGGSLRRAGRDLLLARCSRRHVMWLRSWARRPRDNLCARVTPHAVAVGGRILDGTFVSDSVFWDVAHCGPCAVVPCLCHGL